MSTFLFRMRFRATVALLIAAAAIYGVWCRITGQNPEA